jgi:dimeric dUTPase (all-alpha-NTP-PPase superfamily)
MKEIFDLQWKLNVHTLSKIGLDYASTIADPELKLTWIENYRKALSAELAELIREVDAYGTDTQNGKVEIIDMLHFLVSLSHIVGIDPSEATLREVEPPPFSVCAIRTFLALDDLQNSLKWKWWAKGGGFKADKAREAVLNLWKCFELCCAVFKLSSDDVKRIYIAKNRVNFERQNQSYNEDTKTEADNVSIKV